MVRNCNPVYLRCAMEGARPATPSLVHGDRIHFPVEVDLDALNDEKNDITARVEVEVNSLSADVCRNVVWISPQDRNNWFSRYPNEGRKYLSVGNVLYHVSIRKSLKPSVIAISPKQRSYLLKQGMWRPGEPLYVAPFYSDVNKINKASFVLFSIKEIIPKGTANKGISSRVLLLEELRKEFLPFIKDKFITLEQSFNVSRFGNYKITCKRLVHSNDSQENKNALITEKTTFDFFSKKIKTTNAEEEPINVEPISIVNLVIPSQGCLFTFYLHFDQTKVNDRYVTPMLIDREKIIQLLKTACQNKVLYDGYQFPIAYDNLLIRVFTYRISSSNRPKNIPSVANCDYKVGFKFLEDSLVNPLVSGTNFYLYYPELEPTLAKHIKLKVESFIPRKPEAKASAWVDMNEVCDKLKVLRHIFQAKQVIALETKNGRVELSIDAIIPDGEDVKVENVQRWSWDIKTSFFVNVDVATGVAIIDSEEVKEIKEISFLVDSVKRRTFLEEELQKIAAKLPESLIRNQMLVEKLEDGAEVHLCPDKISYEGVDDVVHGFIGKVTPQTKFTFYSEPSVITIVPKDTEASKMETDPIWMLARWGVGGLTNELEEKLRDLKFSLKHPLIDKVRGVKRLKGLLLYGPPGTGKTILADNIQKILNVDTARVHKISGPSLHDKYVGIPQKKVDELFKETEEDWKNLKEKSPLHLIIIDEIDSAIPLRDGKWSDALTNHILTKVDGMSSVGNFILIGMTNRIEALDPAAIRPGRFDAKVEFKVPEEAARAKIFEIHLRLLKDKYLAKDVDIASLVAMTPEYTGAQIAGVVAGANAIARKRLREIEEKNVGVYKTEELNALPEGQITLADFKQAIREYSENDPYEKDKQQSKEIISRYMM